MIPDLSEIQLASIASADNLIDREVWIVTAAVTSKRRGGLVATWVSAASIDAQRPVLVAGIAPNHYTCELIDDSGGFAAHLLPATELDLAFHFAIGSGRDRDKLAGLSFQPGKMGSPILEESLAWWDCRVFGRLDCGDRIYFWADVVDAGCATQFESPGHHQRPMRESQLISSADEDQLQQLCQNREQDIQQQRPLANKWRQNLPAYLVPRPREN